MQKQAVSLYQTSDGGATWTLKYANDPTQPNNTLPFSGHKNGMTFRDTSTGWVGGDVPSERYVYLYKTTNGGVTWSQQPLTLPAGYESAIINTTAPIFFGANDAILPVWMSTETQAETCSFTSPIMAARPGASHQLLHRQRPELTDFVSINDGFVWDATGFFHVTNNSGASWRQVTPNVNFGDSVARLDFVSTTTGWAYDTDYEWERALSTAQRMAAPPGQALWQYSTPAPQLLPDLTITADEHRIAEHKLSRAGRSNGRASVDQE